MIFRPELIQRILDGDKTVTRRRLTHTGGRRIAYRVGKTYAIQPGRGKKHVGHILVRHMDEQPLGMVTPREAKREGFESVAEFDGYWKMLHGEYNPDEIVARIQFELTQPCAECWDADRDYDLARTDRCNLEQLTRCLKPKGRTIALVGKRRIDRWAKACRGSLCAAYYQAIPIRTRTTGGVDLNARHCSHEWCDAILDVMDRVAHGSYEPSVN